MRPCMRRGDLGRRDRPVFAARASGSSAHPRLRSCRAARRSTPSARGWPAFAAGTTGSCSRSARSGELRDGGERRRVLHRMGVFLVGEAPARAISGVRLASSSASRIVRAAQSRRWRLLASQASTTPASVPCFVGEAHDGGEVALQIAAGDAEAGREIGILRRCARRASAPARSRDQSAPMRSQSPPACWRR